MADLSIDGPSGLPLAVGAMDAGGVYLSAPVFLPRGTVTICAEVRATASSGAGGLTVKIRQGVDKGAPVDRGLTSPGALGTIPSNTRVDALLTDVVVGNYVQLELTCTSGPLDVQAFLGAR